MGQAEQEPASSTAITRSSPHWSRIAATLRARRIHGLLRRALPFERARRISDDDLLEEIVSTARTLPLLKRGSEFDGYPDLAAEKWGCPAVGKLLWRLASEGTTDDATRTLIRLLLDWQNNTFCCCRSTMATPRPAGRR